MTSNTISGSTGLLTGLPRRVRAVAGGLLCALASVAALPASALSDRDLLRHFDTIAFGLEFEKRPNPRVLKWARPMRIYIHELVELAPAQRKFIRQHMATLQKLTGLDVAYTDRRKNANFIIVFSRNADRLKWMTRYLKPPSAKERKFLRHIVRTSTCSAHFRHNRVNGISSVEIFIPVDLAMGRGRWAHCVVEETTQALGLPNDSDDVNPSIFNDRSNIQKIEPHDALLIRMLYHPRMTIGLPRKEAMKVAREILPGLRKETGH